MKSTEPFKAVAPILVFTYGNTSRGDDALGPAMFELLETNKQDSKELDSVDLLTDYQLQIEHAIDLDQRECVVFIDAGMSSLAPYEFNRLQAQRDNSYTTHAMSPAAILDVYRQVNQHSPPPAYMLTIRGYEFALGQDMTEQAKSNLQHAFDFIKKLLSTDYDQWPQLKTVAG